jgi:hypothetical protein
VVLENMLVFLLMILVLFSSYWSYRKAKGMVEAWAATSGLRLLSLQHRWFRCGPYSWNSSRSQIIFFVSLWDGKARRSAYIRCGGWWLGMFSEQMEVKWMD